VKPGYSTDLKTSNVQITQQKPDTYIIRDGEMFNNSKSTDKEVLDNKKVLNQKLSDQVSYHNNIRKLQSNTNRQILKLQQQQVTSHSKAVVSMTKSLEKLVTSTTEMVGFMIGSLIAGGEFSANNLFANFLDMLGQFSIMLGTVAIAASQVFESLFSGNPAGLLIGGLAMIAVGGILKAFGRWWRQ